MIPDYKKSIKQNVFQFELGGKTYETTRFDMLPTSFLESVSELEEKYVLKSMRLAMAGDDENLASALGELPLSHMKGLLEAWQKDAGVSLGESPASDDS
ncbi:hypothetical protein [Cryobacterium sp. BB736]|uniref:hypothetical protein n=1 Tax=Cryobacterium sp. BB736 TaxID=2746963 RepID=UPI0018773371|nr:hypothetical protein [Cryobacterium sp. BB736]